MSLTACSDKDGGSSDSAPQNDADADTDADTDAAGLAALAGCELIDGFLSIESSDLTDLSGLSSLTSVGGDLSIWDNLVLCQSLVDAFIAALGTGLAGDVLHITGNDESC